MPDAFFSRFAPAPGRTLVVGSKLYEGRIDRRALYSDAIGLDMESGAGVDLVHNLEYPLPLGQFDHIDCVSVLEHVQRPWLACAHMQAVMAPGATIAISVPFVWRVHAYPSDYWRMTAEALAVLFPLVKWRKRGYWAGGELYKKPPALTVEGQVFLQKSEVVGFGVLHSDYPDDSDEGGDIPDGTV